MALWKGKGTKAAILNYRDIMLAEGEGKKFGSFIRFSLSWLQ